MSYPPGAICIVHRGTTDFEVARWLWSLQAYQLIPPGTVMVDIEGTAVAFQRNLAIRSALAEFSLAVAPSSSEMRDAGAAAADERNEAIVKALRERPDLAWVFFFDTDQDVEPTVVLDLLAHEQPMVSGVVLQRYFPYEVTAFSSAEPVIRVQPWEVPKTGLLKVAACGTGCLLIRREVLDAVGDPWFRCGALSPELLQEDIDFTLRAAQAGYPPALDGAIRVLHRVDGHIYLGRDGRAWMRPKSATGDVRFPINIRRGGQP